MLEIVAGVDEYGQALTQYLRQTGRQFGAADSAGKREDTKTRRHALHP